MRHSLQLREQAKSLRSKGKTYSEIKATLHKEVPKSVLSYWCRNVKMPAWYKAKVDDLNSKNLKKAQKMALVSNKLKQENLRKDLHKKNLYLAKKINDKGILKALLSMLYLGEGAKWKSHRGLYLGSADKNIIKLYMRLLFLCYGITSKSFKASICYRADQDLSSLQEYWSRVTSIPINHFYPSKPDSRTVGKITQKKEYKGVCSLTCAGTIIQLELETIPQIILMGV